MMRAYSATGAAEPGKIAMMCLRAVTVLLAVVLAMLYLSGQWAG